MTVEKSELIKRGMSARLTDREWDAVSECCTEIREFPAKALITRKGEALDRSLLLLEGIVGRHVPGPHRDFRQMVSLEVPGDFVDFHSVPIGTLDHDVTAMTDVKLAYYPHDLLKALLAEKPDVGLALWAQTVIDASIHRYWSFRAGALRATGRIANFLCEMEARLGMAGLVEDLTFALPLTQTDLGEACGMSAVHVNRVLRELREAKCCVFQDGRVTIIDRPKLTHIGQFEPEFLTIGMKPN